MIRKGEGITEYFSKVKMTDLKKLEKRRVDNKAVLLREKK